MRLTAYGLQLLVEAHNSVGHDATNDYLLKERWTETCLAKRHLRLVKGAATA